MNFLIRCDLECLSRLPCYHEVFPGRAGYEAGRDRLMHDLSAVLTGLRRGAPDCELLIYDEHCDGRNVRLDQLPRGCQAIYGKPRYRADWPGGLDSSIAALVMVGFHAMAGTPGGTLPHTYEHDLEALDVNGVRVGEVGLEAALAGELGVPMILYTGDSAGARETEALIPGVRAVAVKESLGAEAACCLSGPDAAAALAAAAEQAAKGLCWPAPLSLGRPVELVLHLADTPYRAAFERLHSDCVQDHRVILERPTLAAAWADYWLLKEAAQAATAT